MEMVSYGERFFTSLGFEPLPETFWERSLLPASRATATWSATPAPGTSTTDDLRIKMCIEIDGRGLHHHPPRARAQLLPARLPQAADPLPQRRQRRLPRGHRRHHRALGHAGLPEEDRPARQGAGHRGRHRVPDAQGARQGGLPALRPAHRPVALEGLLGRGQARRLQPGLVGAARASTRASRRRSPRGEADFDPGAKYHVPGERALHALLPGRHPAVPVPPRALPRGRIHGPAPPLLDLRQQGGGREAATRCWRWARAGPGRRRSTRSPASGRSTPPRSSTTSRRSRTGWRSRTRESPVGWQ